MSNADRTEYVASFLEALADVFEKHPEMRLTYTTNDDGVWVDGPKLCTYVVCLGTESDTIVSRSRAHAQWLRRAALSGEPS